MKHDRVVLMTVTALLLTGAAVALAPQGSAPQVDYPTGYRYWTHVKSMVIQPDHPLYESSGGFHHVYANGLAVQALRDKTAFADGAVLIFDLFQEKNEDSTVVEGARKMVAVMQKDSRKFSATGGWGFEGFKGDTRERAIADPKSACFDCHAGRASSDYVFSQWRE